MEKTQFFELTKKSSSEFLPGKSDIFLENRTFFRLESKISATGFTTPQTTNQIDAAGTNNKLRPVSGRVTYEMEKNSNSSIRFMAAAAAAADDDVEDKSYQQPVAATACCFWQVISHISIS